MRKANSDLLLVARSGVRGRSSPLHPQGVKMVANRSRTPVCHLCRDGRRRTGEPKAVIRLHTDPRFQFAHVISVRQQNSTDESNGDPGDTLFLRSKSSRGSLLNGD